MVTDTNSHQDGGTTKTMIQLRAEGVDLAMGTLELCPLPGENRIHNKLQCHNDIAIK